MGLYDDIRRFEHIMDEGFPDEPWRSDHHHHCDNCDAMRSVVQAAQNWADLEASPRARYKWLLKVSKERERQDEKWGFPQDNTLAQWSTILGEEVGEVCKAINDFRFVPASLTEIENELVQVAAVAVNILEHLARTEDGL